MSLIPLLSTALFAAIAAWLSQAAFAVPADGARVAVLPTAPAALWIAAFAGVATAACIARGASRAPLFLLALPLLAWLPSRVPAPLLIWTGPIVLAIWAAVAAAMVNSAWRPRLAVPRPVVAAGALAFAIYAAAYAGVAPSVPGGDEPHYLVITQSLLLDGDLKIENNHKRGDYRAYFAGDLSKPDYYRRGRDNEIYSVHAPGVSVLVAPAFAIGGYRAVVIFLLLLSSVTAALAWHLAHKITGSAEAAWFGWASIVFAPTVLLNAFTVYPDGPGALLVLTGIWALIRVHEERTSNAEHARPWFLHGLALAALPWLHTRFALLAAGLGALVVLGLARTRNPAAKASAFLVVPTLSAVAWIGFFILIYGTPDPAIPYRGSDLGSPAYIVGGLGGLLFDQMYGLFSTAPVLAASAAGLLVLGVRKGPFRFLSIQLAFVMLPYVITVTHFAMWWGGFSAPARFLVPLVPALAIPAAVAWAGASRRGTRATMLAGLGGTAFIAAVLVVVERGRIAYFVRDNVYALWVAWANRTADLAHALPAFFARVERGRPGWLFFAESAVWAASVTAAWLVVRAAGERPVLRARGRTASAAVGGMCLAGMLAASIVWRLEQVDGVSPASGAIDVLRHAGGSGQWIALDATRWRPLSAATLTARLAIRLEPRPRRPGGGRADRDMFTLAQVPAGEYRLRAEPPVSSGWLMVGIGRDQFALVTQPAASFGAGVSLRFPVDVRAIVVRADEEARDGVGALTVEPLSIYHGSARLGDDVAVRAVRYGATAVFFLDERSFPEPGAFWLGGSRQSSIVVQPDIPGQSVRLRIRNAPVDNVVRISSGQWREEIRLAAGQERTVQVPIEPLRGAARVEFDVSSGFRPSAIDPASRDDRFLGMWVAIE